MTVQPRAAVLMLLNALALSITASLVGCGKDRPPALHGSRSAIVLEDYTHVPFSSETPPRARINSLIAAPDDSHRLFVNDMVGKIYVIENGKTLAAPFLDIAVLRKGAFTSEDLFEQGLNTFAFHPAFARAGQPGFGKLYTFSTERHGSGTVRFALGNGEAEHEDVVAEWRVDPNDVNRVDPGSYREVLRISHPLHDHIGGQIAFNPRSRPDSPDYGMLYIGIGDGGNTTFRFREVDHWRTAQNKMLPFGKILRINPLAAADAPYTVPQDNPFVGDRQALPEVWAYGLRNPSRFSWDTGGDGKLVIADIGQRQREEINVGDPGANYGWSEREGSRRVEHKDESQSWELPADDAGRHFAYPAVEYGHRVGLAVTGGFVYRGATIPLLQGMYIFGDIVNGRVFAVPVDQLRSGGHTAMYELKFRYRDKEQTVLQMLNAARADLRIGIDDRGEMYLLSKYDGSIRRLAGVSPSDTAILPIDPAMQSLN